MLTQYQLTLRAECPCTPRPEWGYRLYAGLLHSAPAGFGAAVHADAVTPLSQFLTINDEKLIWTVSLLGQRSEETLSPLLERKTHLFLRQDQVPLAVTGRRRDTIRDVEDLFARAAGHSHHHLLRFETATAFKSQGKYVSLPTARLIMQGLVRKWNGSFPDCPIEDEDGQGIEALAAGMVCGRFLLQSQAYELKRVFIPGFVGELELENRLSGFHRDLADALLLFSGYAGIGIKTALGMGGICHSFTDRCG